MCGRFVLPAPASGLVARFGLDECADFGARYDIPADCFYERMPLIVAAGANP